MAGICECITYRSDSYIRWFSYSFPRQIEIRFYSFYHIWSNWNSIYHLLVHS